MDQRNYICTCISMCTKAGVGKGLGMRTTLLLVRESVDSLCRDGADAQYMQYLSKSRITSPQTPKKFI